MSMRNDRYSPNKPGAKKNKTKKIRAKNANEGIPMVPSWSKVRDFYYASDGNRSTCLCPLWGHGENEKIMPVEVLYMSHSDMPKARLCPLWALAHAAQWVGQKRALRVSLLLALIPILNLSQENREKAAWWIMA